MFATPSEVSGLSHSIIKKSHLVELRWDCAVLASDNKVTLLQRLQHKTDLRNTDRNRLTSLAWAAIEGSLEVFEWLLLDYGHDDQELSRVRPIA